ncbi:MAG: hypothetical protein JWQ23_3638 [Herminiimonas sp.]|jgi:hypothetical protein|nr:hypothetical protein [Herminiimonas sp.]
MRYLIMSFSLALAACATPGPGNPNIAIETASGGQFVSGADCQVISSAGNWNVTTPAAVPAANSVGDLRVVCNKPGYRTSEVVYRGNGAGSYGGYGYGGPNVGVGIGGGSGGRVGVGLGIGFPIGGGGGYAAGYPSRILVEMSPQ